MNQFIERNLTPYEGDETFLAGPTDATTALWLRIRELLREERLRGGVLDVDVHTVSSITSHAPGYMMEEETIFSLEEELQG